MDEYIPPPIARKIEKSRMKVSVSESDVHKILVADCYEPLIEANRNQLSIAVANFQWLVKHRDASYYPDSHTVVYGDGGIHVDVLMTPGITPAT